MERQNNSRPLIGLDSIYCQNGDRILVESVTAFGDRDEKPLYDLLFTQVVKILCSHRGFLSDKVAIVMQSNHYNRWWSVGVWRVRSVRPRSCYKYATHSGHFDDRFKHCAERDLISSLNALIFAQAVPIGNAYYSQKGVRSTGLQCHNERPQMNPNLMWYLTLCRREVREDWWLKVPVF